MEVVVEDNEEGDEEGDEEVVEDNETIRRGGGGAWRAFVRRMKSNDLKQVAEAYHGLCAEERAELLREGAEAIAAHREGRDDGTSFGPTSKRTAYVDRKKVAR